jgi:hypothetical protein
MRRPHPGSKSGRGRHGGEAWEATRASFVGVRRDNTSNLSVSDSRVASPYPKTFQRHRLARRPPCIFAESAAREDLC